MLFVPENTKETAVKLSKIPSCQSELWFVIEEPQKNKCLFIFPVRAEAPQG